MSCSFQAHLLLGRAGLRPVMGFQHGVLACIKFWVSQIWDWDNWDNWHNWDNWDNWDTPQNRIIQTTKSRSHLLRFESTDQMISSSAGTPVDHGGAFQHGAKERTELAKNKNHYRLFPSGHCPSNVSHTAGAPLIFLWQCTC